jgi:hypothetical protein
MMNSTINEQNDIDIEKVLLEEDYYNKKDLKKYHSLKNNIILLDFFYKLNLYIATAMLILVDMFIIAYFLLDDNDNLLKEEYSDSIKTYSVMSFFLYILSLIFYIIYKRTSESLKKFKIEK